MTRRCKVCRKAFEPRLPMQSVCSPACALSLAKSTRAKAEKAEQVVSQTELGTLAADVAKKALERLKGKLEGEKK